ncbi:MAG: AsmA family protein [Steroidobacteraceae bacterium]
MRVLRILALVLGAVVAVLALALLAIWLFVDPNDYKDRIAQGVRSATGRELTIDGRIGLSVFPWLALTVERARLGNPPGFEGSEPFAAVERAALRVRVLPLLHRELQVGRVELDGLDLRLRRNDAGKGNWEDFGGEQRGDTAPANGTSPTAIELSGIRLTHGRIAFEELLAQDLDVEAGRVAPAAATPVKLSLNLRTAKDAPLRDVAGGFELLADTAADRYRFSGLALQGKLPAAEGATAQAWSFAAPVLELDLGAQTLAAARFESRFGLAALSGSLAGERIVDAPVVRGEFDLAPLALRELLSQLGIQPPATKDAGVLAKLAARGAFEYSGDLLRTRKLAVQLDDSKIEGSLALNLDSGAKDFDIAIDRIDIDRYLPPPSAAPTAKAEPFQLPADSLKALRAKGTLAIGETRINGVQLAALRLGLDAADGLTRVAPARARLYGGQYSGDITIDARAATPTLRMQQTMSGVDVAHLLQDFAQTRRLSGRGTLVTDLSAQGRDGDALMRTLRGSIKADLADGAVEGIDVWYAIAQAQSLLQKRTLAGGTNTRRTAFDTFSASADVVNGVATTRNLAVASQLLRVSGQGSTNLVTQALDYRLTATVLKAPPQADQSLESLTRASIPVTIGGTFDDPKIRPDLAGLAKARVNEEIEKHKDEVKQKLQDKLKDLFNR